MPKALYRTTKKTGPPKFLDYTNLNSFHIIQDKKEMAQHTMEVVYPDFAKSVSPGDIIVGGKNFGCGSSREQAVEVFKTLGISAIIADSFARIFYRNCVNVGLPIIECNDIYSKITQGDVIEVNISEGKIYNTRDSKEYFGISLPDFLLEIINDGGLVEHDVKLGL